MIASEEAKSFHTVLLCRQQKLKAGVVSTMEIRFGPFSAETWLTDYKFSMLIANEIENILYVSVSIWLQLKA